MNNVAKSAIGLMIATIIAKVIGFGRELVLASSYGASMYSDAYIIAMNIPLVIVTIIGGIISTVFIPIFYKVSQEENSSAIKFTNNIFNIVLIISSILAILALIFTEPIVKLFAMGFEGKTLDIAINFTRITIVSIIFTGLSYVMTSYLQVKNNFVVPGLISVPKNIIIIVAIILSIKYNPYIMVWGILLGTFSEFLFQLPFVIKNGYRYKLYLNLKDKYIKEAAVLILPVLMGVAVYQVNIMIDRTLASTLGEGAVSALNYANKLNEFVTAMFITSISAVIYPMLSKLSAEESKDKFIKSVATSINSVILLVTPISVGAIVLANPIVKLLFERGQFDEQATNLTSTALIMYSLGMVAFGLREILTKVFYSLQDSKTPMKNATIAIVINIILNIILVRYLKIAGVALATSISAVICIFMLLSNLKKKIGYFGQKKILITAIKSLISSIIMGAITYNSYNILNNMLSSSFINSAISLGVAVILGVITYIISIIILKVDELNIILDKVINKGKRNLEKIS